MRVLVTGSAGQLGRDIVSVLGRAPVLGTDPQFASRLATGRREWDVVPADHSRLDVSDRSAVMAFVQTVLPDVVIHAAAWTAVDACESDPDRAFATNALGTRHVAEACERVGAHLVYLSTDYVFDGSADHPYREWDQPNPLSVYGQSKLGGELELHPGSTVVRISWVCGAHGSNMVRTILDLARSGKALKFVDDQRGSPTFTADLAPLLVLMAAEKLPGVFHVTNQGSTTWFEFARAVMRAAGHDAERVEPISTAELKPPRPAQRPANSVLDNCALRQLGLPLLPEWNLGLERLVGALKA